MVVETGTSAGELLDGTDLADTLDGAGGNDTITGGGGDDSLIGGTGTDSIDGGAGNDNIVAGSGLIADGLEPAGAAPDTLIGGAGDDTMSGYGNTTIMMGGAGNDNMQGGPDGLSDTLDGGSGADTLIGQGGADVYIVDTALDFVAEFEYDDYAVGTTDATGDVDEIRSTVSWVMRDWNDDGFNVENLTLLGSADLDGTGNEVANVVTGNSGDNELFGLANDDTLDGGAGDDTIDGGADDDLMTGGSGADTFVFNTLSGDDTITDFQVGTDLLDFSAFTQTQIDNQVVSEDIDGNRVISIGGATITLLGVTNTPPTQYIIEGTDVTEVLDGDAGANAIFGYDGNDTINGDDGSDILYDGRGTDRITGGDGADTYLVGSREDVVIEAVGGGDDTVISYGDNYTLANNVENLFLADLATVFDDGLRGLNTIRQANRPEVSGSDDVETALAGFDAAAFYQRESENFNDRALNPNGTGNQLDNLIVGNNGNNILIGQAGNDTIDGGLGDDIMTGGIGADTFKFTTAASPGDRITDFTSGQDKIDLTELNVNAGNAFSNGQIAGLGGLDMVFVRTDLVGATAGSGANARVEFDASNAFGARTAGIYAAYNEEQAQSYFTVAGSYDFGGFSVTADMSTAFTEDDFIYSVRQTDSYSEWDAGTSFGQFGPGETTTWSVGAQYSEATFRNFGADDYLEVELQNGTGTSEDFGYNLGLDLAHDLGNGLELKLGYQHSDTTAPNATIVDSAVIGVSVRFRVAEPDQIRAAVSDQGTPTNALVLSIDRDFDGTADFELELQGEYEDTIFRTEFVNENMVLSVYEGNSEWTGSLQIAGTQRVFQEVSADISNLFDRDGIDLSTATYQWYRNGVAIDGETLDSYTLALGDAGTVINVEMKYTDLFGNDETVVSETSLPIGLTDLPAMGTVSIEGSARQGETLSVDASDVVDPNVIDPRTATYQWLRDGVAIDGATSYDYTLVQRDVGSTISLFYAFEDFYGGSDDKTSASTSTVQNVNDTAEGRVSFTGRVETGQTLQADLSEIRDLDGTDGISGTASYVWLRGDTAISGATGASYTVTDADLADGIAVRVNFTDDLGGSETLTSKVIAAPIAGVSLTGTPEVDGLNGSVGEDTLDGLASDDLLTGGASDDTIDGGEGLDTAVFAGNQSSYSVKISGDAVIVEDRRDADDGGQGTDRLSSVELLDFGTEVSVFGGNPMDLTQFGDVASLNEADFTAFIELYIAYFNRAPDAIGLFFWGTALQKGLGLNEIATLFFDQDETRATYPFLSNVEDFAKEVYSNVLGREFDQAGLDFWVGVLEDGSVPLATFMLEIINGAKAAPQPGDAPELTAQKLEDVAYLTNKADLGAYFSVIKGMSDVDNAVAAMQLYDGTQGSIDAAKAAIDDFYEDALDANNGEFLLSLSGVVDDPFAIA